MAYTKTTWVDEVLAGAERFEILDNNGDAVDNVTDLAQCQIALATAVTTPGTPVNAANLNNMENAIEDLDNRTGNLETTAIYQIIAVPDDEYLEAKDGYVSFLIADIHNGLNVVGITAYVTDVSTSGNVVVRVYNVSKAHIVGTATILQSANFSSSSSITNSGVSSLDVLRIDVTSNGVDVRGLIVIVKLGA